MSDREVRFDNLPAGAAHSAAQIGIVGEQIDGLEPFRRRLDEKASYTMTHEFFLNADRIGDHRQSRGHILQELQAALAFAPPILGKPADADVGLGEIVGLGGFIPATEVDAQVFQS